MPGKYDGLAVCRELRQKSGSIGIILLTARTQEMDKVSGLMMGADDYVTKPFSPSELVARVDAVYRRVALEQMRNENNFKEEIRSGDFALNLRNRTLMKKGEPIELTQVEFQIMEYFFSSPTAALDRTDILKHDNTLTHIVSAPGLWVQRITTKEPDDSMIEVAIAAMKKVIPENGEDKIGL